MNKLRPHSTSIFPIYLQNFLYFLTFYFYFLYFHALLSCNFFFCLFPIASWCIPEFADFRQNNSIFMHKKNHAFTRYQQLDKFIFWELVMNFAVLCLDFIGSLQNYWLFHKSLAKIVHVFEIICKKNVYVGYQPWEEVRETTVNFINWVWN